MLDDAKVRRLQARVGAPVDGDFGPQTLDLTMTALGLPLIVASPTSPAAAVPAPAPFARPPWTAFGLSKLGEKEIAGVHNNPWILSMWQYVGVTWFRDDETAWCGGFQAWCMKQAGIAPPPTAELARAAAWATWGIACAPQVGAIGVKHRAGGNHVFQIVGETADKRYFKALGGNQSNGVSIMDIAKSDAYAIRWPLAVPQSHIALPVMAAGAISKDEA